MSDVAVLAEVGEFLAQCLPFDDLERDVIADLAGQLRVSYRRRGHHFPPDDGLSIIRSGVVDEFCDGELVQRLEYGESFSCAAADPSEFVAFEDCLIYRLPGQALDTLRREHRHIDRYFHAGGERRLRRAARYRGQVSFLMQTVSAAMTCDPLQLGADSSIRAVAQAMSQRRVSSALIVNDGKLLGIVTDRDLRCRVLAAGIDSATRIAEIMSPAPRCVQSDATLFDAVLVMTNHRVHHLPVLDEQQKLLGVLSTSDVSVAREDDPVFFVQRLSRLATPEALREHVARLPKLFQQWVSADTPVQQLTQLTTAVSDALTRRLIVLAQQQLGPAPCEYCWLSFGSQARGEQLLGGDQDNGLLIADGASDADMGWFAEFADYVCRGLNDCGYDFCPGDVMAKSEKWRQRAADWCLTVDDWMRSPSPSAVMRISIFFDMRAIAGSHELAATLQQHMLAHSQRNTIFLAALAENVLESSPPLGVFGRFLLERSGAHQHEFDLKKRGVLPLVELARLHALANGLTAVNTHKRLQALARSGQMSLADSRNLEDALTLINRIRVQHQAQQIADAEPPDNYCDPRRLTRLQRSHLKQAFKVVHQAEEYIKLRYRAGV